MYVVFGGGGVEVMTVRGRARLDRPLAHQCAEN